MKTTYLYIGFLSLALALAPPGFADSKIVPNSSDNDDIAVDTRGLVHEAYAAPVNFSPRPGPVVDKKPPDPIKELPPDQKPEGDNVEWIPGYWGWDTDRKDYVWVSGLWRVPPPDRKWVPGHWSEADGGWQWVAGLWASAALETIPYLDEAPPDSLDAGPNVPAPDDDSIYIPGNWVPQSEGYAWQAGYWADARPGYVWTPPQYTWTPAGYCYVDGYWDYPLEDRGLLFAPVYFNRPLWTNPDWYYQPSYCLPFGGLLASLFACPFWNHYCFGDYYGAGYYDRGFYTWFSYGRHWHDPLFGYYNWRNRDNPGWYGGLAGDYRARLNGDVPRPPRTLAQQNALAQRFSNGALDRRTINSLQTVKPLSQMGGSGVHLAKLTPAQANSARQHVAAFSQVSRDRQRLERPAAAGARRPGGLSLAHVPTTSASRGNRSAAGPASPSRSAYRGSPSPAYARASNRGAAVNSRNTHPSADPSGLPNAAARSSAGAARNFSSPGGHANAGNFATPQNASRHSSPSAPARRSQPPAHASTNHAAPQFHSSARPAVTHHAQQAPQAASHASSAPSHRAPSPNRGGGGHSGGGGHASSGHSSGGHSGGGGHASSGHGGGGGHASSGHGGGGGHASSGGHSGGGGHASGGHGGGGGHSQSSNNHDKGKH
jgi:hypothetical protein